MDSMEGPDNGGNQTQQGVGTPDPQCFYLITYPRTASNLLVRILALDEQPAVVHGKQGYFFLPPASLAGKLKLRKKVVADWTRDEKNQMMQSYQDSFDELEKQIRTAKAEQKIVFVKEHVTFMIEPTARAKFALSQSSVKEPPWTVQTHDIPRSEATRSSLNETILPDEFLRIWKPTFLIRHPALAFPSLHRCNRDLQEETTDRQQKSMMTLHWVRTLYDWYVQHFNETTSESDGDATWPLVLEADDILTEPEVIVRFCEILGLDSTKLQFNWAPADEEKLAELGDDIVRRMLSTLSASAGIMGGKTSAGLDIDAEAKKWREEFGEDMGIKMEGWVRAAMPDYEFLWARRLRPKEK